MHELRKARHRFAALCALLLLLPVLFTVAPRPTQASADYIAALTGYTLCTPTGNLAQSGKQAPQSPCEDCLNGASCPVCSSIVPRIFAVLTPMRNVAYRLSAEAEPLKAQTIFAVQAARGPPFFI